MRRIMNVQDNMSQTITAKEHLKNRPNGDSQIASYNILREL
jgi:hypothetical protein